MYRSLITLSAMALTGALFVGAGHLARRWRRTQFDFDVPMENLFV